MKKNLFRLAWVLAVTAFLSFSGNGTVGADELELSSAGPIAFGPEGLLLISDPMGATIYAVETGDTEGSAEDVTVEVEDVKSKVASMLGTEAANVRINDLAINPINGRPYLSVTRGLSPRLIRPGSNNKVRRVESRLHNSCSISRKGSTTGVPSSLRI